VLAWTASRTRDPALREQCRAARVTSSGRDGAVWRADIHVPRSVTRVAWSVSPAFETPSIESTALEQGGGSVLFFEAGRLTALECYAFDGRDFPADPGASRLLPWRESDLRDSRA